MPPSIPHSWRTLTVGAVLLSACASLNSHAQGTGWKPLFDGSSTAAWHGYQKTGMPAGWSVVDGTLSKSAPVEDIITKETFGDFELEFEWKLGKGGNSGVFYRATEEYEHVYWSGPEYQLLDNVNNPGDTPLTFAGSIYALYPAAAGATKPFGEWNTARIVLKNGHLEHWLNGTKVAEAQVGSADWDAKVKKSKFGVWPNFGRAARGAIAIQGDHQGPLGIRNMRIRPLN
ncbi:MAG: 3-keto-disaccharide hydrolase [Gemmatimonadaceae bacterium]